MSERNKVMMIGEKSAPILSAALGLYLNYLTTTLNRKEFEPDEDFFSLMDVYATAGDLWSKSLKFQGMDQDEINELLAVVSIKGGSDD